MKQKLKSGEEVDAICAREWHRWKPRQLRRVKKALGRRVRSEGKKLCLTSHIEQ